MEMFSKILNAFFSFLQKVLFIQVLWRIASCISDLALCKCSCINACSECWWLALLIYISEILARNVGVNTICDSAVGIAAGYGLDVRGIEVRVAVGSKIFSSSRRPDRFWSLPSFLSDGYRGKSGRGVKPTTTTNIVNKKTWIYTFTPPYVFMA
jgi:hypothetical protein